ncbi:MAG: glycoside hydrolase family 43 protein [Sphingomicrobium sp.]|nr:glycoside hydrolase family 43 protein [Sphingomonadales bacterium]
MRQFLPVAALLLAATHPATRYSNPVINRDFPDPSVIRASDGFYYVYATQSTGDDGKWRNIQAARSSDLVHWTDLGDVLPSKPSWARRTQDFWAPDVIQDHGHYILYYSAKPDEALSNDKQGLCLAVATATQPQGPFTDSGRPLICGPGFENIDPMAFDDPATGRRLLYWGSGFGPIKVQPLASDRMSFAPGSNPVSLLAPIKSNDAREYRRLVEGAWVVHHAGYYYLFASGDNCCGPNAHYAVLIARSRSATGPFTMRRRPLYTVVAGDADWIAPGHNSVIRDGKGVSWMLYHGVDARRPRTKPSDEINTRRVMLLDRLEWRNGWPETSGKRPSRTQRVPLTEPFKHR